MARTITVVAPTKIPRSTSEVAGALKRSSSRTATFGQLTERAIVTETGSVANTYNIVLVKDSGATIAELHMLNKALYNVKSEIGVVAAGDNVLVRYINNQRDQPRISALD